MADVIYKYKLPSPAEVDGDFWVNLPKGAEVLSVQLQQVHPVIEQLEPMLWARVDNKELLDVRRAQWIATGQPIYFGDALRFVGTVQFKSYTMPLVFHLYVEDKVTIRG